jgi:hypothetical protein
MKLSKDYSVNKHMFLLSKDYADKSIKAFLNFHKSHILRLERIKNKDLLYFTNEEIKELARSVEKVLSPSSVMTIRSFINKYYEWGKENNLDVNFEFNPVVFQIVYTADWYINLDDFYKICERMLEKTSVSNIIPLILARYAIVGTDLKTMMNIKWNDIDAINLKANIKKDNEIIRKLPIDYRFICWLYITKCSHFERQGISELDKGYILRTKTHSKGETVNYNTIYTKQMVCFDSIKMDRINFKDLFNSRVVDILYSKYGDNINEHEIIKTLNSLGERSDTKRTRIVKIKNACDIITENNIKVSMIESCY